jgi:hypothetical protein
MGIQNTYVGIIQLQTVVVHVAGPGGLPINQGFVSFQVNGQTLTAPVVNGFADVTFGTSLLDFGLMFDLILPHPLFANYNGSGNLFAPSSSATSVPGLLVDFLFFQIALELQALNT